jgi:hypothetical protein
VVLLCLLLHSSIQMIMRLSSYWQRSALLECMRFIDLLIINHFNCDMSIFFFRCISFPTVYLYGGELFPTVIRNIAIGTASMIARIGSMISPFVASGLSKTAYWLPPVIFGIVPIIGAVLVLFLPGMYNILS